MLLVSFVNIRDVQVTKKQGEGDVWVVWVSGVPAMELLQRSPHPTVEAVTAQRTCEDQQVSTEQGSSPRPHIGCPEETH